MSTINILELKAVLLGLQALFFRVYNAHIRIKSDSSTVVCYINYKGGSKSKPCDKLSIELWYWCLKRNNIVPAEHVRGTHNLEADLKSRNFDIALSGVLMTQFFS